MVSDKVNFDFGSENEDSYYKSSFARSMAVNSQCRESKPVDFRKLQRSDNSFDYNNAYSNQKFATRSLEPDVLRSQKDLQIQSDFVNRMAWGSANSSRRTSLCSSKILEAPVENIYLQSQLVTLQWQLKETESSREMYRAVMRQVVSFLERAHHSLELMTSRMNNTQKVVRPHSEYHMSSTIMENDSMNSYKDVSWERSRKQEMLTEEMPCDKLSQEAFRLLRTAQSLLSTHEPNLAGLSSNSEEDINFLTQLAKEFPPTDIKPHRTTSISLCPKLLTPEKEIKISTAFNRKLSLQLNDNVRRSSFLKDFSGKLNRSNQSSRSSVTESDCILSSTLVDDNSLKSIGKFKYEQTSSPPVSSIGSADESGFSSMNSFQEIGLPTITNDDPSDAFLKLKLNSNDHKDYPDYFIKKQTEEMKLWQTPNVLHRRWSSTPVDNTPEKTAIKVLWV